MLGLAATAILESDFFLQLFGPIALLAAMLALASFFITHLSNAYIPNFIPLASITFAILYSFIFLIAPEFEFSEGLRPGGPGCLALFLIFGFVITAICLVSYADSTFVLPRVCADISKAACDQKHWLNTLINDTYYSLGGDQRLNLNWSVDLFLQFHILVLALLFTGIDVVFLLYSHKHSARFRKIVLIIDIPICLAVLGTILIKTHIESAYQDTFESGAISFQFVSGSIAAYMLDNYSALQDSLGRRTSCVRRRLVLFPDRAKIF